MDMSKNLPINLEMDINEEEEQIRIMEGSDQVPEMQSNLHASGSHSQFQDSCSPSASTTSKSKRVRTTSNVWDYFDMEYHDDGNNNKTKMAKCKYCKKLFTAKPSSGTTHLKRHHEKYFPKHQGPQGGMQPTQSTLQLNKDGSVSTWNYDPLVVRESLVRFIASKDLPLSIGESDEYEEHIRRSYHLYFKNVSRNTTRSDLLKVYKNMCTELISEILALNFCIALTSDIWGINSKQDYISVVAYYCDKKYSR